MSYTVCETEGKNALRREMLDQRRKRKMKKESSSRRDVFVRQSSSGPVEVSASGLRISQLRQVPVAGSITPENVEWVITQCELLIREDAQRPITLFISSPGGSIDAAYHLIDYMEAAPVAFIAVASETCASAATQIFASVEKGCRLVMKHARIMIHKPLVRPDDYLNSTSLKSISEMLDETERLLYEDLAGWTGQTLSRIEKDCEKETWLKGEEAVKYGIADALYSYDAYRELLKSCISGAAY